MPAGESQDKFECRYCGCKQSRVQQTNIIERKWKNKSITIIKRRRICRHCAMPQTTVEHVYEDAGDHEIPHDSAMRPAYDYGRAVGMSEFINGVLKPSEELPTPKQPQSQPPRRSRSARSDDGRQPSQRSAAARSLPHRNKATRRKS